MPYLSHENRFKNGVFVAPPPNLTLESIYSSPPLLSFLWGAGMGADPGRPPCRKAKDLRKERRLQKEQIRQADGVSSIVSPTPPAPAQPKLPKALEDFINESLPENSSHRLEVSRNIEWVVSFSLFM